MIGARHFGIPSRVRAASPARTGARPGFLSWLGLALLRYAARIYIALALLVAIAASLICTLMLTVVLPWLALSAIAVILFRWLS